MTRLSNNKSKMDNIFFFLLCKILARFNCSSYSCAGIFLRSSCDIMFDSNSLGSFVRNILVLIHLLQPNVRPMGRKCLPWNIGGFEMHLVK